MNRRRAICHVLSAAPAAFAQAGADGHLAWKNSVVQRWRQAEVYTQDVLDIMPEADLKYAPFAGEMTFCEHLTHLAFYNVFLLTAIQRQGPPSQMDALMNGWAEPRNASKELAREYLQRTFERAQNLMEQLTPSDLKRAGIRPGEGFTSVHTGEELVWRALTHTFHHRAQAIVYLRGKGLKPPLYRF
jgi:uncharacterized damage-inducible protein DinB